MLQKNREGGRINCKKAYYQKDLISKYTRSKPMRLRGVYGSMP